MKNKRHFAIVSMNPVLDTIDGTSLYYCKTLNFSFCFISGADSRYIFVRKMITNSNINTTDILSRLKEKSRFIIFFFNRQWSVNSKQP